MLKSLLTCVNDKYNLFITPNGSSVNQQKPKQPSQPLLTLSSKDELPEILRDTFEIFNKFIRNEMKKNTTQIEKDILYECVFKMRCIYDGIINHRYLDMTDNNLKAQGAEE